MGDGRGRGVRTPPDPGEDEPREEDRDERVPRILPRVERGEEQAREDHAEDRLEHAADGEFLAHTGRDCGRDRTHGGQHPGKELAVGRLVRDGPAERMPDDGDGPVKEPEDHDQHHGHAEREEHLPGRGTDEGKPVERLGKVPADEEPDHQERSVDDEEEGVGLGPCEVTRALAEVPAAEEVLGEEGRRAVHDQGHGRDQAEREHEHERDRLHERGGVERHEAREPPAERREKPDERGEAEERPEPEEGQHCRCDSGGEHPRIDRPGRHDRENAERQRNEDEGPDDPEQEHRGQVPEGAGILGQVCGHGQEHEWRDLGRAREDEDELADGIGARKEEEHDHDCGPDRSDEERAIPGPVGGRHHVRGGRGLLRVHSGCGGSGYFSLLLLPGPKLGVRRRKDRRKRRRGRTADER